MSPIVAQKYIPGKKWLFGLLGPGEPKQEDTRMWHLTGTEWKDEKPKNAEAAKYVRVTTKPFEMEMLFSGVRTQYGYAADVRVTVLCEILQKDTPRFLERWDAQIEDSVMLSPADMNERLEGAVLPKIADRLAEYDFDDLAKKNYLPVTAWQTDKTLILGVFKDFGLTIREVKPPEYLCEEKSRKDEVEKFRRENDQRRQRELALQKQKMEVNAEINRIQNGIWCDEAEMQAKLEEVRILAAGRLEYIQLEHQLKCQKIRNEIADAQQRRDLEDYLRVMAEKLESMEKAMKEGRFDTLKKAEIASTRFRELREKAVKFGVDVRKAVSRDIMGTSLATLRIGDSLAFEFTSPLDGFATIINLGTSDRFWLHVPNVDVAPGKAKVRANTKYFVPGDLLPLPENFRYEECGPAGREELIVLVTPTPLVSDVGKPDDPEANLFTELRAERLETLLAELEKMPVKGFGLGRLRFDVW